MNTNTPEAPAPVTEFPQQTPNKSKIPLFVKIIIVGVVGFIGLIVALFIFVFSLTKDASNAAGNVIDDIQAGQCVRVYTDQATPYFQTLGTQDLWVAECERIGAILTGSIDQTNVSVESSSGQNSTGTVSFSIVGTDDVTYDVVLGMEKVDGVWKMDTFSSNPRGAASQENNGDADALDE